MDRIYRRQRFIYDITRRYYLFGRDRLIAELAPDDGSVLEIGCGTGRNLAAIAKRYPSARLHGLDISAAMLETARTTFARRRLTGRITTALGDATAFDPLICLNCSSFDRILFSYTLSMIPDWRGALDQAVARLAPSGRLLLVDFGELKRYPRLLRRGLSAWLRAFHVQPIGDLPEALSALADREGLVLDCRQLLGGYAVLATLQRPAPAGLASTFAANHRDWGRDPRRAAGMVMDQRHVSRRSTCIVGAESASTIMAEHPE